MYKRQVISDLSMPPQWNNLWAVCGQISVSSHFWQCHASNYIDYLKQYNNGIHDNDSGMEVYGLGT